MTDHTKEEWEREVSKCILLLMRHLRWDAHDLLIQEQIDLGPLVERARTDD